MSEKVRPIQDPEHQEAHDAEAREGGVEEYVDFVEVETTGAVLHVALAGPKDGEPVLMLHGFPDLWVTWAWQVKPLIDAGYRLIMPDQRGYNLSSRPRQVEAYGMEVMEQDHLDLLEALGYGDRKVHLVGHDWGGAMSWWLAEHYPDRWETLTVLNCPPMKVLAKAAQKHLRQIRRSWYIAFFQVPLVPEKLAAAGDFRALESALKKGAAPSAFTAGDLEVLRRAWGRPGAVRGMINWYRAGTKTLRKSGRSKKITVPTTILWGEQDFALHELLVEPSAARCETVEVKRFPAAGHWVHREAPEAIAEAMVEAFGARS